MPKVLFQYQEPMDQFRKVFKSIVFSKLFNIFSLLFLVLAIPITVFYAQQQQELRQHAQGKSSTPILNNAKLFVTPVTSRFSVGETQAFDIIVDPAGHLVSFIKITLHHTIPHLSPTTVTPCKASVCINTESFPSMLEEPSLSPGFISFAVTIGAEPKNAINKVTKVATVYFKAEKTTEPYKATIDFLTLNNSTQILSLSPDDPPTANILGDSLSAEMIITK